jgi:hypothetical protein
MTWRNETKEAKFNRARSVMQFFVRLLIFTFDLVALLLDTLIIIFKMTPTAEARTAFA